MDSVEELAPTRARLVWFTAPVSNALTRWTSWWCAVHVVGGYYSDNMPVLNQTVWDAQHAAGGAAFNHRTEL